MTRARVFGAASLSAIAVVLFAIEVASWSSSARLNSNVLPVARCTSRVVATTDADRALGIREGDALDLPRMDWSARLIAVFRPLPVETGRAGERIELATSRDGRLIKIPYVLEHSNNPTLFALQLLFKMFMLALGLFALWRGRDRASLALGVWCLGIMVCLPDTWLGALSPGARMALGVLAAGLWTYSPLPLYLVIEALTRSVSPAVIWVARALMLGTVLPSLFDRTANVVAQTASGCALVPMGTAFINTLFIATQLVMVGFFAVSFFAATGLLRQRISWVFWSYLLSRIGVLLNLLNRTLPHPMHLSGIEWLTVMIFPLGCTYGILRHRIINVDFVLNRTLIYTILTTLAVGIFILLENAFNGIAVNRGVSLAVELLVALTLGFSFKALHRQVELAIDRTLFRRKHEASIALQTLSDEAAYMENPDALLARAVQEISSVLGAEGAAVFERADTTYRLAAATANFAAPREIEVDDLAFVRMRKRLTFVELGDVESALGIKGVAFPLTVRGELYGALVCGARKDGETYAPDELRLVQSVAHEVGAELHAIRARQQSELLEALMDRSIDLQTARAKLHASSLPVVVGQDLSDG